MTIITQIEIEAPPEEVWKVFLDFENWPKIKSDTIKAVARQPGHPEGPIKEGEVLNVNFGINSTVTVLENSPSQFRWRGDMLYVISGEHTFRFEPSKITPGGTTFINSEIPFRLNVLLMRLLPAESMFQQFCKDFKARVESAVKKEAGGGTTTTL
ncbi:uncharacterized protein LY89DRAFT_680570 [Mollisia scopiformis]|uniref:Uncharacterized protein n=1 Tax=Mollisia scopiformis TaxID=149040 RepID=A0A194XQF4_MOLSC|nr:uncharacterized protein LY89DRAFT_680570 [Mollisia scopiformis]KUJ22423.1 hypothetical protein LY89DRAFT_680570 [Mollisia scopiformis]